MLRNALIFLAAVLLAGCTEATSQEPEARILVMGDSMFAFYSTAGRGVADNLETYLEEPVLDRSVTAARYVYPATPGGLAGLRLSAQYVEGDWDFIVMNGGGNDLLFGCGCGACAERLDRLISTDGEQGTIPDFMRRITATGAQVMYSGYLRTPGFASPIEDCAAPGAELERRLSVMARQMRNVTFVSMAEIVPDGDMSFHANDRIHPSQKGSRAIAQRIAAQIRATRR